MYSIPKIQINGTKEKPAPYENSILDYMGVPTKIENMFTINALPIRAYVKIWNEYFRDQNVGNAATSTDDDRGEIYTDDGDNQDEEETLKRARSGGRCLPVNKFHDYFTSCLPYPQRGPEVNIPMSGNAPVNAYSGYPLSKANETSLSIRGFSTTGTGTTDYQLNEITSAAGKVPVQLTGTKIADCDVPQCLYLFTVSAATSCHCFIILLYRYCVSQLVYCRCGYCAEVCA
jgi:hypothetical protein